MSESPRTLRPTLLVRIACAGVYVAAVTAVMFRLPFGWPDRYRPIVLGILAVVGAFWLADVLLRRIVLYDDRLQLVSLTLRLPAFVARGDIERVTWEKGAGAALRVRDGRWVRLPNVGLSSRAVTAIIRAWLNRAEPVPE